jgi:hypothetical protein
MKSNKRKFEQANSYDEDPSVLHEINKLFENNKKTSDKIEILPEVEVDLISLMEGNINYEGDLPKAVNNSGAFLLSQFKFWYLFILYKKKLLGEELTYKYVIYLTYNCSSSVNNLPTEFHQLISKISEELGSRQEDKMDVEVCLIPSKKKKETNISKNNQPHLTVPSSSVSLAAKNSNNPFTMRTPKEEKLKYLENNPNPELLEFFPLEKKYKNHIEGILVDFKSKWGISERPNLLLLYQKPELYSMYKGKLDCCSFALDHIMRKKHTSKYLILDRKFNSDQEVKEWLMKFSLMTEADEINDIVKLEYKTLVLIKIPVTPEEIIKYIKTSLYENKFIKIKRKDKENLYKINKINFECYGIKYSTTFNDQLYIKVNSEEDIKLDEEYDISSIYSLNITDKNAKIFYPISKNTADKLDLYPYSEGLGDIESGKYEKVKNIPDIKIICIKNFEHIFLLTDKAFKEFIKIVDEDPRIRFIINNNLKKEDILILLANSFHTYAEQLYDEVKYLPRIEIKKRYLNYEEIPSIDGEPIIQDIFSAVGVIDYLKHRWGTLDDFYGLQNIFDLPQHTYLGTLIVEFNDKFFHVNAHR